MTAMQTPPSIASFMEVSCKFHESSMQVPCKFRASFIQGPCKFHASLIQVSCKFHRIRTCMRTHPFPISWKKVHILSLRREQSADILCMVSSLLLPVTAVLLHHGRLEGSSQRLFFICSLYPLLVSMFFLLVVFHCSIPVWFTFLGSFSRFP